jgi:hypothetical protein
VKKLLIAAIALVACGITVQAAGTASLSVDAPCSDDELVVVAHEGTDHYFAGLGKGVLSFSGPSKIKDIPWRWDPAGNQSEQVIATASFTDLNLGNGGYTVTMREGRHLSAEFSICNCATPAPSPSATPTQTPTPSPSATAPPPPPPPPPPRPGARPTPPGKTPRRPPPPPPPPPPPAALRPPQRRLQHRARHRPAALGKPPRPHSVA